MSGANDSTRKSTRASARLITVEPVTLLVAVLIGVYTLVTPQYLQQRIASANNVTLDTARGDDNGGNETGNVSSGASPVNDRNDPYYVSLQMIQAEVSFWQMLFLVAANLPPFFTSPLLGSWSDKIGRKPIIALSTSGYLISSLVYLAVFYLVLPLWVLTIGLLIQGITGGHVLVTASCVAYITDITAEDKRLLRIGIVHGTFLLGIGLTQVAMGYTIQVYGFAPALWVTVGAILTCLVYIPLCLIETVDKKHTTTRESKETHVSESGSTGFVPESVSLNRDPNEDDAEKTRHMQLSKTSSGKIATRLQSFVKLFKTNTERRRLRLIILYTTELLNEILNQATVPLIIIYGLGPPFYWSSVLVAGYWTSLLFSSALVMIILTKVLSLCLADFWVLQVSMIFAILNGFLTAFAKRTVGLYVAALVGSIRTMSRPLIPLILSKMVEQDEHGVVFAFEASVMNLGAILSPVFINNLYTFTVNIQPNLVFIVIGALSFIPLITTGVLQVITNRTVKHLASSTSELDDHEIELARSTESPHLEPMT